MPDPIAGTYLSKKPHVRICECGVVTYRGWQWSEKSSRQEPCWYDCEATGNKRPTVRIAGFGQVHICKQKGAA